MAIRRQETFEQVTLGHIRSHGCRSLLVYCNSGRCHHSTTLNADCWSDDQLMQCSKEGRTRSPRQRARAASAAHRDRAPWRSVD